MTYATKEDLEKSGLFTIDEKEVDPSTFSNIPQTSDDLHARLTELTASIAAHKLGLEECLINAKELVAIVPERLRPLEGETEREWACRIFGLEKECVMEEKQESPKVFGCEMERYSTDGWLLNIATLTLTINLRRPGIYDVDVQAGNYAYHDKRETLEASIEWLETTARRIMSECLEIARPMITIEAPRFQGDTEELLRTLDAFRKQAGLSNA